jgi:hypothetical protein
MTKMQEHARELGHIDLVLSQLPMDVLQELQMSATQELNVCTEKTSSELVKITTENVALETEYNKVKQERDEVQESRMNATGIRESISRTPRGAGREGGPVEDQVTKISESIQGFHACIVDLEAHA